MNKKFSNILTAAVIMSGGGGTRLKPLSTDERPKQFMNFIGDQTFIRQTFERISPLVNNDGIFASTNERYVQLVEEQIPEIPRENILGEPLKKNTAPALAYATAAIVNKFGGDAIICCLPSDHYIADEEGFRRVLKLGIDLAADGYLVTLGMKPTWPSTEYGYICPNTLDESSTVKSFKEKPDEKTAQEYVEAGYLWNGGVFIWKANVFLDELKKYAPNVFDRLEQFKTGKEFCSRYFESAPSISVDYAVMEKSDRIAVVRTDVGWNDVGTWESIERLMKSGVRISQEALLFLKNGEKEYNPFEERIFKKPDDYVLPENAPCDIPAPFKAEILKHHGWTEILISKSNEYCGKHIVFDKQIIFSGTASGQIVAYVPFNPALQGTVAISFLLGDVWKKCLLSKGEYFDIPKGSLYLIEGIDEKNNLLLNSSNDIALAECKIPFILAEAVSSKKPFFQEKSAWGWERIIANGESCLKELCIKAKKSLSTQVHGRKGAGRPKIETFYVISEPPLMTMLGIFGKPLKLVHLRPREILHIQPGLIHKPIGHEDMDTIFYENSTWGELTNTDVIRLEAKDSSLVGTYLP